MPAAPAARSVNPKRAAISAITRKMMVHRSMGKVVLVPTSYDMDRGTPGNPAQPSFSIMPSTMP